MEHSEKYDVVKGYYERHLWPAAWVRRAVTCKWITTEECAEILGE